MSTAKVLIADDETRMRKLVSDFLKKEGCSVLEAKDGKQALDIFYGQTSLDLIILDVMMPELDGWAVCRDIRKHDPRIPIIMLTARSEEADEVFGFDIGADDYITKPFSPTILVARVQALLRRIENSRKTIKEFDGLEIDEEGYVARVDGMPVDLTTKEFEILLYLAANKGIVLSREKLLEAIWDYNFSGDARSVDQYIKRIRAKLGDKGDYIQTIRGLGYKFEVKK